MSVTKAQLVGGVGLSTVGDLTVYGGVNATGVVTASSAVITGNVSIGGTLTYEDVTNIDSIGIITARSGINVTGGSVVVGSAVTLSSGGVNVVGVVTATQVNDAGGNLRSLPNNDKTASYILTVNDVGELINITTGGVTVPSSIFAVGNSVTIYNNSGLSQTITQGSGVTLRLAGVSNTGNRTLDQRGLANVLCVGSDEFVISGAGLS